MRNSGSIHASSGCFPHQISRCLPGFWLCPDSEQSQKARMMMGWIPLREQPANPGPVGSGEKGDPDGAAELGLPRPMTPGQRRLPQTCLDA